jgi:hypothetical protein
MFFVLLDVISRQPTIADISHPRSDVNELLSLISVVRGFPSVKDKDVYGFDTKLDFNTVRSLLWPTET